MTTAEPGEPSAERLLVRDLAQLVTHRGSAAPLRGSELREVELVENAFVLAEGGMIVATGRMEKLGDRLVQAKAEYLEQQAHDNKIFGDRFVPD